MEKYTTLLTGGSGVASLGFVVFAVICIIILKGKKNKRMIRPYMDRMPAVELLSDMPVGEKFIVVSLTELGDPIAQLLPEFFKESKDEEEGKCFIIFDAEGLNLKPFTSYEIENPGGEQQLAKVKEIRIHTVPVPVE